MFFVSVALFINILSVIMPSVVVPYGALLFDLRLIYMSDFRVHFSIEFAHFREKKFYCWFSKPEGFRVNEPLNSTLIFCTILHLL